jgi:AbiV family abortive infection protein
VNKAKNDISYGNISKHKLYQGVLTPAQIAVGINYSHENGLRLLADAKMLFDGERFPSSVTLSLLAVEEFAKELILRKMAIRDRKEQVQPFWAQMKDHRIKAAIGALPYLIQNGQVDVEEAAAQIESPDANYGEIFNWLKETGLYVECVKDAKWLRPTDQLDKTIAESIYRGAEMMAGTGKPYPVTKKQIQDMQSLAKDPHLSRQKVEAFAEQYRSSDQE